MKLSSVARYFDKTVCQDAYNPLVTLKGQLEPFVVFTVDAARVKRRLFSIAPGTTLPVRRAIRVDQQVYLVGDRTDDHWAGKAIRENYVLVGADNLATIRTIPQALQDADGHQAYVVREWTRTETDGRDSAERFSAYSLFFTPGEPIQRTQVVQIGSDYYFVHEVRKSLSGLTDAMAVELSGPVFETASFVAQAYNPKTDTNTTSTVSARVLRVRWQEAFKYLTEYSQEYERGDDILMVLKTAVTAPKPSDRVTLSTGAHFIVSLRDEGAYWALQVRRA